MPAALHNAYIAESILHELPGELMRAYAHNRKRLGTLGLKTPKSADLETYKKKIAAVRKSYNIDEKIEPSDQTVDMVMSQKMGLSWTDYIALTMQCWQGCDDILVMNSRY